MGYSIDDGPHHLIWNECAFVFRQVATVRPSASLRDPMLNSRPLIGYSICNQYHWINHAIASERAAESVEKCLIHVKCRLT